MSGLPAVPLRVGFAGTPEFASTALAGLHAAGHTIALVLTQPDRPAGRGMKLHASPVKQFAQTHGLPLVQPRSLRLDGRHPQDAQAAQAALHSARLDVLVVAAYGLILPQWTLDMPRWGCLNIHGSLLPRWRGAAPIHRAIEAGDTQTGITIMQMDAGLDTGDMLMVAPQAIGPDDTTASLHDQLAALGARLIAEAVERLPSGDLQPTPQPSEGVNYAHKIDKSEASIDWREPAAQIERRIRAFDPFPGAHFVWPGVDASVQDSVVKVWKARVVTHQGPPGSVLPSPPGQWVVACGEQALSLEVLQRPGGKRMGVQELLQSTGVLPGSLPLPALATAPSTP